MTDLTEDSHVLIGGPFNGDRIPGTTAGGWFEQGIVGQNGLVTVHRYRRASLTSWDYEGVSKTYDYNESRLQSLADNIRFLFRDA